MVLDLTQLCDICVKEERVRYLGKGYLLMLRLAAGFSYPLTQSATLGARRYVSRTHCVEIPILVIPELLSAVLQIASNRTPDTFLSPSTWAEEPTWPLKTLLWQVSLERELVISADLLV